MEHISAVTTYGVQFGTYHKRTKSTKLLDKFNLVSDGKTVLVGVSYEEFCNRLQAESIDADSVNVYLEMMKD